MNRPCFTLVVVLCASTCPSFAAETRPNFLFIYADDQRWDALGVVQREQGDRARFPWFRTPHMDRLAREGVRFRNAFVVNSLCAPSRAVFLTGRYNHHNGIASNFRPFPIENVTHATLLRAAGYTTGYIGKWHMDSQRERPGFDSVASFLGHARYVDPVFIVDGKDTPTKGWIDDISTDHAIEFLRRQKASAKPWSLVVGFKSPHGPFDPPARAKDRFAGEKARPAPNLGSPAPYLGEAGKERAAEASASVRVNLDYFRCISAVDDCIGRLLDALDDLGLAANTVVVYTSDNGFYLGEHGLADKRSAYDESLRIPFLVRYPALGAAARGRTMDEMVLNLDLAPTWLDLAGLPVPKEMQGRSWRPLLSGQRAGWRRDWLYEYFAERQASSRVPDITAVRTANAKLIKYPGNDAWTEMFDLRADPYETRNLYDEPRHSALRTQLEVAHERLLHETGYRVPEFVDRPEWWVKPGAAGVAPEAAQPLRLSFEAENLDGARLSDSSGLANHGEIRGVTRVEGRQGRKALRFDGLAFIEIPKSKSLNPAGRAWTIEAVVKAEKPDCAILARGGRIQGYALWLKGGRPVFSVNVRGSVASAEAKEPVSDWAAVSGLITADKHAELRIDGKTVARVPLPNLIPADPTEGMQIGADRGSPVIDPAPPPFVGLIESVRISAPETRP